ncbi:hypothetical protein B0H17DRAFT_1191593 [Mycena rosella]|uniref:Uncharacterized protein n=1 Tax=Mycena rosella TaxID=1033263 RepID=A0AAD7GYN4_MYCRO|nr:hypothetical protein B0H17DRAFT_1191593 [Mycena rosella]
MQRPPSPAHVPLVPTPARATVPAAPTDASQLAPEHPYAKARDAAYAEPKGRNYGAPAPAPVKKHDPAYLTATPVFDNKIATDVFDRSMNVPATISHRELLSIAPDVRAQYKEATTGRRIIADVLTAPVVPQLITTVEEPLAFGSEPSVGLLGRAGCICPN